MSDFIIDNTQLWDDKVNFNEPKVPTEEWGSADAAMVKSALLSIQLYLRSGEFAATPTINIRDINLDSSEEPDVGPELDWIGHSGHWFVGIDVANTVTSRDFVMMGVRGTYSFPDGAITSGSPTLTSASGGGFKPGLVAAGGLVGAGISGAGIPSGTTVTAVASATSLTMSANATATATGVRVTITRNTVQDLGYWKHRGGLSPTFGVGVTPPDGSARLQVSAQDDEPAMGTIRIRRGPSQTGNVLAIHDSTPTDRVVVDPNFYLTGAHPTTNAGVTIAASNADPVNQRCLTFTDPTRTHFYGFEFPTGSGNVARFRCQSGGPASYDVGTDGSFRHLGTPLGFFGANTITKPTVTGSRGGNAALASLLTALANLGLITDSTTA